MEDKTVQQSGALALICPTCGARYTLPKYVEGQRYGCKRCSASLMFGKFALQQELGRGGFGVVYKAFQADLQRVVALKFLHTDSEESTERFMREARIAANLSHPNITAIYEVGQHEGKPYITMQFVDGITTNKASFSVREAVFVVRDAAIAVDYAHARDVIHRDIKPHNIMVTQERSGTSPAETTRRTFVMDFGLARSANKGGTLTTEGQVMGTPAFMSPEQAEGKTCDLRSDVYSLGATLYSLGAKRPPFEAPTPLQILMAVTQEDPPPPSKFNPDIDKGLEAIILKAMAKDPAHRYPTASRFAQDLTSWLAGGVTDAGPTVHLSMTPGALQAAAARKKSRNSMIVVGVLLIVAGLSGLVWHFLPRGKENPGGISQLPPPVVPPGLGTTPATPTIPVAVATSTVLLEVFTTPPEATVRIGTKEYKSPIILNDTQISPATYEVVISKKGFETWKESVTVTAGPKPVTIDKKLVTETRKVAFLVDSDPPGAKIFLNGTGTGLTTPHTFYQDEVEPTMQVELELDGFGPEKRSFTIGDSKRVPLTARTGAFLLNGTVPGAKVYLFAMPASVKNLRAVAGLWSENPDSLQQSVAAFDAADAPLVVERLKSLMSRPEAAIKERAAKLSAAAPAPTPLKPGPPATADGRGSARLDGAWVQNRYRIFVTSPRTLDYLSDELEPQTRQEISVTAEATVIVSVGAKAVRPAVGKFRVLEGDPNGTGELFPGGAPLRVKAGLLSLEYVPPPNDPLLRAFTVPLNLKESYELAGNLYQYCAEAYYKDQNIPMTVRAYTKLLDEKQFLSTEQPERAKLPELIRGYYRGWIEKYVKEGKTLGGDLAAALEEARKKDPSDAVPLLIELYTAKDATPAIRGGAAAALAHSHAKQAHPYEAMEWCDRFVLERVDPGQETASAVATAIKGYPGLAERWEGVAAGIEEARKAAAQAKTDPPPVPAPAQPDKVGTLNVTKFGTYVRLDPNIQLAKGDVLSVFRNGGLVGEISVEKLLAPDKGYPNGSWECRRSQGAVVTGDEVRKKK
jgi:predicted Ser/Thr protein kinase